MRLTKIKLSGFKSFVDPTNFHLPGGLVGIVGPNGCGKSNLIDAVRWVMGESSAKQLRGDSMADVIFNGSSSRKPVGQASIELVFDNSAGRLGGEYARYREIAVRRVVSRDGQSHYFLNGSRCRRRDVTDVFLGTGLGPRSYAIIEQGTISRVVEASPEQLRGFLEEAAGISRYKERRRETENRIRHTRENLERVDDLREELGKQLEKLQRQARNAERYRALKGEERARRGNLLALRWRGLEQRVSELERETQAISVQLEAGVSRQREAEAGLLRARERLHDANEQLNERQAAFYAAGAEVARVEQSIRHARELRSQRREDETRTRHALQEVDRHLEHDRAEQERAEAFLTQASPKLAAATSAQDQAATELRAAEDARDQARQRLEHLTRDAADARRAAEVERTHIDHLERQLTRTDERCRKLSAELEDLSHAAPDDTASASASALAEADAEVARLDQELADIAAASEGLRGREQELMTALAQRRGTLQRDQGRLASLETLQEAALAEGSAEPEACLAAGALRDTERLADVIRVQAGWESAVEAVLGDRVGAHCVASLDDAARALEPSQEGRVSLYDTSIDSTRGPASGDALSAVVQAPWALEGLLAHARRAQSLEHALQLRGELASHEIAVTPDGTLVGRDWFQREQGVDPAAGVLARAREMDALREQLALTAATLEETEQALASCREALAIQESTRVRCQLESTAAHRAQAELRAQQVAREQRALETARRGERLQQEADELALQRGDEWEELQLARDRLQEQLEVLSTANRAQEEAAAELGAIEQTLRGRRDEARDKATAVGKLTVEVETRRSAQASLKLALGRQSEQRQRLMQQLSELQRALAESESPLPTLETELEQLLRARSTTESALAAAREAVAGAEATARDLDGERLAAERSVEEVRARLEAVRLAAGEARARREAVNDQLSELGVGRDRALAELAADLEEATLQAELERLQRSIERLGPINLAAIEEFELESERKRYLDAQHADLTEAMETLEAAIQRIDRETRQRFKATYDKVNAGIGELFPRLFGGGTAFLELVGDDLLDAGVAVMARPPGKRISNIHLLSGGEKALTAVSLVFTIFRLNPAPFCMLDEVDAPLDEANVGRYCDLVREMSQKVQFIVITHNKTTMEALAHLVGVTMHEPGCSRLVTVDVEEAARLAAV